MWIKTTISHHYITIRMAKIKNSDDIKCCWGCRGNRSLIHCLCKCKMVQSQWKAVWQFLLNLNIQLVLHSWTFILENWKCVDTKILYVNVYSSFICNHPKLEAIQSFSGWIMAQAVGHSYMRYYWAIKKHKILIHATPLMNFQRITILSEISQFPKAVTIPLNTVPHRWRYTHTFFFCSVSLENPD